MDFQMFLSCKINEHTHRYTFDDHKFNLVIDSAINTEIF